MKTPKNISGTLISRLAELGQVTISEFNYGSFGDGLREHNGVTIPIIQITYERGSINQVYNIVKRFKNYKVVYTSIWNNYAEIAIESDYTEATEAQRIQQLYHDTYHMFMHEHYFVSNEYNDINEASKEAERQARLAIARDAINR